MANQHRCVFVGNIPYDATEEQLIQICEEVGPVVSFRLVIDRETGKPKGYGFCEYKDEETALSARRNLQGYEINGRQLRVDFAENDKGVDKSREQGRGGPGLTSNADGQRSLGGPAIPGDTSFYQPIGLQSSSIAASVMAGALGGVQIDSMSAKQNGLQSHSSFANDPLTLYLANMSKKQLSDILSEMKVMVTQNKDLAHQLLSLCPLLPKALFQAQIIMGMVTPQVLQMPNIRQSPNSLLQPSLQDGMRDPKLPVLPPYPGQLSLSQNNMQLGGMSRVPEGQGSAMPQNTLFNNQFPQPPMPSRFQNAPQVQGQPFLPTSGSSQPGVSTVPSQQPLIGLSMRPQLPPLDSSTVLKQQMQAPPLHNPRPAGAANNAHLGFPNSAHHSVLSRPLSTQPNYLPGSSNSLVSRGMPDNVNKHGGAQHPNEATWLPGSNSNFPTGLPVQQSIAGKSFDPTHHPSKLARLEDGRSAIHTMAGQNTSNASGSGAAPFHGTPSLQGNQIPSAELTQNSDKQILQLPPEMHSALLEQVKSLTPEQLSSLPPEQRQQVLDLQKMLKGR